MRLQRIRSPGFLCSGERLSVLWSRRDVTQLIGLAFYFWLWLYGHVRSAESGCIASVSPRDLICWLVDKGNIWDTGEGELGQYVQTLCAPTILVSVNPLIMAFITSKNTRVGHKAGACLPVSPIR